MSATSAATCLREGFRLIWHPALRVYVLVPLLINVLVFGGLFYWSLHGIGLLIEAAVAWLPDWLDWLSWLMWPVAVLLVLVVAMYSFSTLANLLAAPFNGLLAEKTEELLTNVPVQSKESFWGAVQQTPRIVAKEWHKLAFQLRWLIPLLLVSVIPGINLLAPVLWFCFSAWMTALEYCDYPMDNHNMPFAAVRECVGNQRGAGFSYGALVMLGNMVPLLNLVMMPAAVCGATVLWLERLQQRES